MLPAVSRSVPVQENERTDQGPNNEERKEELDSNAKHLPERSLNARESQRCVILGRHCHRLLIRALSGPATIVDAQSTMSNVPPDLACCLEWCTRHFASTTPVTTT